MKIFSEIFKIEKKPAKGLMAFEWVVLAYMALTLLVMLFTYTKLPNPESMLVGRLRVAVIMAAMWGVYRLLPCRATMMLRAAVQMALLAWWYPDTYEINRLFPNLDHVFATWEQQLFGFQPALVFARNFPSAVIGELMDMGYFLYYPMIGAVTFWYFLFRYKEFKRVAFILLGSFFIYYVVFIFLPVVGPTFYYKAVGLDSVARGVFPALHDYFNTHTDCLPSPGYADGLFYRLVEDAKATGERPTAAFPSSHVGVSTVCMLLAWHSGSRKMFWGFLPVYLFLCMATVYIQAHYLVDALAGFASAVVIYAALFFSTRKMA